MIGNKNKIVKSSSERVHTRMEDATKDIPDFVDVQDDPEKFDIKHSSSDRTWRFKKWALLVIPLLIINFGMIAIIIMYPSSALWFIVPAITLSHARDILYVSAGLFARLFRQKKRNWGKKSKINPDAIVVVGCVVTCFTEKYETVLETIRCLYASADACDITTVKAIVICVCDGQLVGSENTEALGDSFLKKMVQTKKPLVKKYKTWKKDECTAVIHYGTLDDKPFMLIRKMKNYGKKDGLILAANLIHDINRKSKQYKRFGITENIKYLHSTDADTATDLNCIGNSVKNMEMYPEVDGAVNLLRVRFHKPSFFWDHLQHFQYFSSQFIRRYAESFFAKVTCLSGSGNMVRTSSHNVQYSDHHYNAYPTTTSLIDVVPKMQGTDRRRTTLMLKADRSSKLVMLDKTYVETETPQDVLTYISQRKRWSGNSFFNSVVNIFSRNFPWYTKLSAFVDILRIYTTYFRIFSYIWFLTHVQHIRLEAVLFVVASSGAVYLYTITMILIYGYRRLSLVYGFVLNKLTTPFFSALIFYEVVFRFDDFNWGMTQKFKDEVYSENDLKIHGWGEPVGVDDSSSDCSITPSNPPRKKNRRKKLKAIGTANRNLTKDGKLVENGAKTKLVFKDGKFQRIIDQQQQPAPTHHYSGKPGGNKVNKDKEEANEPRGMITMDGTGGNGSVSQPFGDSKKETACEINIKPVPKVVSKYSPEWFALNYPERKNSTPGVNADADVNGIPVPPPPPPPFSANGIPPPPPPPPIQGLDTSAKKTSFIKLRRFHWDPLPADLLKNSFWRLSNSHLNGSPSPKHKRLMEDEIQRIFTIDDAAKVGAAAVETASLVLVKYERAHKAGIILNQVRRHFPDDEACLQAFVHALVALKQNQIPLEKLKAFMTLFPLDDAEITAIKEYKGDETKLRFVDRFFLRTYSIPRLHERMKCCILSRVLTSRIKNVRRQCNILQNVCVELRESNNFRDFLRIVLKTGKILNKGTPHENAGGFKIASLLKLKETRTKRGADPDVKTLLDYVVKIIAEQNIALLKINEELPSLTLLEGISYDDLVVEMTSIDDDVKFLKSEVELAGAMCNECSDAEVSNEKRLEIKRHETFFKKYNHYTDFIQERTGKVHKIMGETKKVLTKTMEFYGEMSTNEFFPVIIQFINDIRLNEFRNNRIDRPVATNVVATDAVIDTTVSTNDVVADTDVSTNDVVTDTTVESKI